MWVRVLGSAAGGGFPQWNCACPNCCAARDGLAIPRTQSSIAISADYQHWFLFNASPDIRTQINASPPLCPPQHGHVRHTPIEAVVLSDAEIDHTLGLLVLRETRSLRIYATAWVHNALTNWNPLLRTLSAYCSVEWMPMRLLAPVALLQMDGTASGLQCQPFTTLSGKALIYATDTAPDPESVVGYRITDTHTGHTLVYMPAVQELNTALLTALQGCACLLIDGTCWYDDELARLNIRQKTARAMGHLPISGVDGSLEQLSALPIERIVYIHINNTNPILRENSPQRKSVEEHGFAVAYDGMEMEI